MKFIKFVWAKNEEDFVLEWAAELGWTNDPFEERIPEDVSNQIADYSEQRGKLNLFIINRVPFGLIAGDEGTGKTMLLRWLYHELETHGDKVVPIYVDADTIQEENRLISHFALEVTGFFGRVFRSYKQVRTRHDLMRYIKHNLGSRRLVVLVDDVHLLAKDPFLLLKQLIDEKMPMQMILAGTKRELEKSPMAHLGHDQLHVTLDRMDFAGVRAMIERRIESVGGEGIHPFTTETIEQIITHAKGNPSAILRDCRKLAIKSTVSKKMAGEDIATPPTPPSGSVAAQASGSGGKDLHPPTHLDKIKQKISTIEYVKGRKEPKQKQPVEVVEHKGKKPSEGDVDLDDKEKNDKLIHELFDTD